jgi:hypothetical protein
MSQIVQTIGKHLSLNLPLSVCFSFALDLEYSRNSSPLTFVNLISLVSITEGIEKKLTYSCIKMPSKLIVRFSNADSV